MARIVIVPGLAVRRYAEPGANAVRALGHQVTVLPAPTWHGTSTDLAQYGRNLAADIDQRAEPVDLLVGLSVGTQAAAVAAGTSSLVPRLMLVSPTVERSLRRPRKLLAAWLFRHQQGDPKALQQIPDWARSGIPRILEGLVSATRTPIDDHLATFTGDLTVVHPEFDTLGGETYARSLGGRFVFVPQGAHSWPVNDAEAFARLMDTIVKGGTP